MASSSDPAYHGLLKLEKGSSMYVRLVITDYLCSIGRKQASLKGKAAVCCGNMFSGALCKQSP